jgi:ABC-type tungstate transport system permease subunit
MALNAVRTQAFDGSYQTLHINAREKLYIYIYIYICERKVLYIYFSVVSTLLSTFFKKKKTKKENMDQVKCIKKEDGKFIVQERDINGK